MRKALAWLNRDETKAFAMILMLSSGVIHQAFYSLKTNFSNASFLDVSYSLNGVQFRDVMVNFDKLSKYVVHSATVIIPPANIKIKIEPSENLSTTLSASQCKANGSGTSRLAFCDEGEIVVRSEEDFLEWTRYLNEKKNLGFEYLKNKPVRVLPNH